MSRAVMAVPSPLQGQPPPPIDAYWQGRGATPLGTSGLGATLTVTSDVVKLLLEQGWTVSSWVTP